MKTLPSMALAAALGLSGCFYPAPRGKDLELRVDKLTADNAQMGAQLKEQQEKLIPKIDAKIAEVTTALEGLDKASRRSDADIGIQMQKSLEDVAQLRGQVETYLHRISDLEDNLKKLSSDTDQRFTSMQGTEAKSDADAKKKFEDLQKPTEPHKFLELASAKAREGDQPLARKLYSEFVKKWPKDASISDAYFGLGETFRVEDKCREAMAEYGKVVQDYSKSKIAPEAWLRSSECFKALKMEDKSRQALDEILASYPKSDAAKTAKLRIAELEKTKKKKAVTTTASKKGSK